MTWQKVFIDIESNFANSTSKIKMASEKIKPETIVLGALLITILAGAVYLSFGNIELRILNDRAEFRVDGDLVGIERNILLKDEIALEPKNIIINTTINETLNISLVTRTADYGDGIIIKDYYTFLGAKDKATPFPEFHYVEITNGAGYVYQYQVDNLIYYGESKELKDVLFMDFGKNMTVTWDDEYSYAKIFDTSTLRIRYTPIGTFEQYYVRLFNPSALKKIDEMIKLKAESRLEVQ